MEEEERVCIVCGKKFLTRRLNQITFSKECSAENNRRLARLRYRADKELNKELLGENPNGYDRECVVCGKKFHTRAYNKITCSIDCYNKIRGKHREAYITEKPHINRMGEILEISKRGIHYGHIVIEMEKGNEVSRKR